VILKGFDEIEDHNDILSTKIGFDVVYECNGTVKSLLEKQRDCFLV